MSQDFLIYYFFGYRYIMFLSWRKVSLLCYRPCLVKFVSTNTHRIDCFSKSQSSNQNKYPYPLSETYSKSFASKLQKDMFVIGVIGISCSGKSTLSQNLQQILGKENCLLMSMDDYYKELSEEQSKVLYNDEAEINFDCPAAIDFDLMISHLERIFSNKEVDIPRFDTGSCVVSSYSKIVPSQYKYLLIEGVFLLCNEKIRNMLDLKIWTEASEYVCALRRFIKYSRDIKGYSTEYIYNQCVKFVIPG